MKWRYDKNGFLMAAILSLHFEQEPMKCHRGSRDFWNQHTLKPLRTNFGASFRKCTTRPKFVTYLLHYSVFQCRSDTNLNKFLKIRNVLICLEEFCESLYRSFPRA